MRRVLIGLAFWAAGLAPASPQSLPAPEPPLWTRDPVRIDPSNQTLPRMPDRVETETALSGPRIILRPGPRPRIIDSITLETGGKRFRLADIAEIARDRGCTDATGRKWACGLRAFNALARFVANRTLDCTPRSPLDQDPVLVDCKLADRSLALDLVLAGWATPFATSGALAEAGEKARKARRGVYGSPYVDPAVVDN